MMLENASAESSEWKSFMIQVRPIVYLRSLRERHGYRYSQIRGSEFPFFCDVMLTAGSNAIPFPLGSRPGEDEPALALAGRNQSEHSGLLSTGSLVGHPELANKSRVKSIEE